MAVIVTRDIETPLGKMRVGACEGALVFALWLTGEPERVERIIARTAGRCGAGAVLQGNSSLIDEAEVQIMEYLAGRRTIFELPIRLHGTDFQRHVWHVLTDINYGCATTYGMLALMAGCEGGSRAVGSAVGANPVSYTHLLEGAPKGGVWLAGSLVLMRVCGLIMHAVVNQSLLPAEWMNWYAPNGEIEPYGRSLHSVTPARLLFFLLLSLPVTAGWLFGMRRYLLSSGETDYGYVDFIEGLAHGMARVGSVLVLLAGAAWMATLPETMSWFAGSVWMWIGLVPVSYTHRSPEAVWEDKLQTMISAPVYRT